MTSGRARQIRLDAGLTQPAMAVRLGISPSAIARWENGNRVPRDEVLGDYLALLDQLVGRNGWSVPSEVSFKVVPDAPAVVTAASVPGEPLDDLDDEADRAAGRVQRELGNVAATAAAAVVSAGLADPNELNVIRQQWTQAVDEKLLPAMARLIVRASAQQAARAAAAAPALDAGAIRLLDESEAVAQYLQTARNRLVGISDDLWQHARDGMMQGVQAGESIPKLASRVREAADVTQPRATVIARTETISAHNFGSIETMRQTGLVTEKIWISTSDDRTRETHAEADGQRVPLEEPFIVGGVGLDFPGDPAGPPDEVINCRCSIGYEVSEGEQTEDAAELELPTTASQEAEPIVAAEVSDTTGMIALRPADPEQFVVDGGDPADEMHVTLVFLGDEVTDQQHSAAREAAAEVARGLAGPFEARVAGYGLLGDEGAVVLYLNGDGLAEARTRLAEVHDDESIPVQHSPWLAHMTLGYGIDVEAAERFVGTEFVIDAVTVDVGGESERFELGTGNDEEDEDMGATTTAADTVTLQDEETSETATREVRFEGVAVVEGQWTGDGRQFAEGGLSWPDLSDTQVSLQWQKETNHGGINDVTVNVGRLTLLERVDGGRIRVEGVIDADSEDGAEAVRRMSLDPPTLGGVSIVADDPDNGEVEFVWPEGCDDLDDETPSELDDVEMRCFEPEGVIFHTGRIRALTLVDVPAFVEAKIQLTEPVEPLVAAVIGSTDLPVADRDHDWDASGARQRVFDACTSGETVDTDCVSRAFLWRDPDQDPDNMGAYSLGFADIVNDQLQIIPRGVAATAGGRGVDAADIPADDKDRIRSRICTLYSTIRAKFDDWPDCPFDQEASVNTEAELVASMLSPMIAAAHTIAIPDRPPVDWFSEPAELPEVGAITVTDEGRFYGLLAPKDVAHRALADKRVTVPMGNVDYGLWMNRQTILADGSRITTGPITMSCGHATPIPQVTGPMAQDHYDNSCSVVATVRIGEGKHGVWVAGALLPDVTPAQVARMLACQLSGDWRPHREKPGKREFCGGLLVPRPGFPVSAGQAAMRMDQGELVASAAPVRWLAAGAVEVEEPATVGAEPEAEETADPEPTATPVTESAAIDLPSWEDIQAKRDHKAQIDALAAEVLGG